MSTAPPERPPALPTVLVVFGATGDLMRKKIVPSLFHLFNKNRLPSLLRVIGVARRDINDEAFRASVFDMVSAHGDAPAAACEAFCELFSYQQGFFDDREAYAAIHQTLAKSDLSWGVCANKLFYLAVPPEHYEGIFTELARSGLTAPCSAKEGWSRVLVEKPFGKDLKTAERLDALLGKLFQEVQIYRIDHYLAKEMLQNILAFRFSNNLLEKTWDRESIEKVEIRLFEKIGVEDRGSFYDGVGALRDVGQNHLLQIAALLAMDRPAQFSADAIREKRTEIMETLTPPAEEEIRTFTFRAQYDGYRNIAGVDPASITETYFRVRAFSSHPRFEEVPFILESGKKLAEQRKEAVITFRHPAPCLCPEGEAHYKNTLRIVFEPEEKITLAFWSKKPGLAFKLEERDLSFVMREAAGKRQYTEEYEKLLYDCIVGDQTLFVTSREVQAMWRYIDPIIEAWRKNAVPLPVYPRESDKPIAESRWIAEGISPATTTAIRKKDIGVIGLGKMGGNIARRLMEKGWRVAGYNRTPEATQELEREGLVAAGSLKEIVEKLPSPRTLWLMVPAGKPIDEALFGTEGLASHLAKGDVVIDGGNSWYKDSIRRFKKLKKRGIHLIDVGVSGGPAGARSGASLMIGGEEETFRALEPLFRDLAVEGGYRFFEGAGAGHFVKMIHNGIEYGMMQAIAEGFAILKKSRYALDLVRIAEVYDHGSVIASRLVAWLKKAFESRGEDLKGVSGSVAHTGEGRWSVEAGEELKIKTPVITEALRFRIRSAKTPSYTGKIVSALREQFGGHVVTKRTNNGISSLHHRSGS